jgi:uncharacterized membrane protein YhaH (DUF805 family)
MGSFSPIHWLILVVELVLFVAGLVAIVRILRRLGYSGWWVLLLFVPIANIIGVWNLSKADWPAVSARE